MEHDDSENTHDFEGSSLPWQEHFDPQSLIGWVVGGKYKIVRYLSGGGFGEVYEGVNLKLVEQRVVIKFLKRVHSRERFEKEARFLCLLDHPNICRIIDYFPADQAVVMPYIKGRDFEQILREGKPLEDSTILSVALAVTSAMAYAHRESIAHRDIKPSNIMMDQHGHVYLIDFGIAKQMDSTSFTRTGEQPLTPQFAAPERLEINPQYDPILSDVYEIGSTLFKLISNCAPHEFTRWRDSNFEPNENVKHLSSQMKHIIRKATQYEPQNRYQSVDEMIRDLKEVASIYIHHRRWPYMALIVLLVVAISGSYLFRDVLIRVYDGVKMAFTDSNAVETEGNALYHDNRGSDTEGSLLSGGGIEPKKAEIDTNGVNKAPTIADHAASIKMTGGETELKNGTTSKSKESEGRGTKRVPPKDTYVEDNSKPATRPPKLKMTILSEPLNVQMYLNDTVEVGQVPVSLDSGIYYLKAVHPDYPLYFDTVHLAGDTVINVNFPSIFKDRASISLLIGSFQDFGDKSLEVFLNGKSYRYSYDDLPTMDLSIIKGKWEILFRLADRSGMVLSADSTAIFPYSANSRVTILGGGGVVDFDRNAWSEQSRIPMVVYFGPGN